MAHFPLSLNTSTIRPIPVLEKINIAGLIGFNAVELWIDELDTHVSRGGTLQEVTRALEDNGLDVASVIALFGWMDDRSGSASRKLDECRRRMDVAAEIRSRTIIASPPQETIDLNLAGRRYHELCELGRSHGVRVSVEFLGFVDGVKTLQAARTIVEQSKEQGGSLVADVYHLLRGGGSLDDLRLCRGDEIAVFHINDLPAYPSVTEQDDGDRVMLGEGIVDLPRVIANLREIGYQGPISLELFNIHLYMQDPLDVCRMGMEQMRLLVES